MSDKILVVDDEPNLLRLVGYALHIEGYETIVAQDGEEALEKIRDEKPDLVVLDVSMPKIDGFEVCRRLRNDPETVSLPIIMLSARAHTPDKITGLQAGADDYVAKPVSPDEIVARVGALLERTRLLRQAAAAPQGRALGFIGAKGGVGTTTVALNVASSLARSEKNVVVVELRPYYGTLSVNLGYGTDKSLVPLLTLDPNRITERELNEQLSTTRFGLKVLPGPKGTDGITEIEPDRATAILNELACTFDYVVVDLPSQPSEANEAALRCCESVTVMVEGEPSCMAAARVTLEWLESWGQDRASLGIVVVNRVHLPVPMPLTEIKSQLGCGIVGVVPSAPEACAAAVASAIPLVLSKPNTVVATCLQEIADRLVSGEVAEQFA